MGTIQSNISTSVAEVTSQVEANVISCYLDAEVSGRTSQLILTGERLLTVQALQLLIRLDRDLRETRADWNHDRFRRIMRARSNAVSRVRRRWQRLNPVPAIGLGRMRRRYHANLARYLYQA